MFAVAVNDPSSTQTYALSSWLFLRALGLIYAIAFVSLGGQITGLVGERGILPAKEFLQSRRSLWGKLAVWSYPTLCWLRCEDGFLRLLCWGGASLSLLVVIGVATPLVLLLLWVFYLSLFTVCRAFLGYQWDVLLLEAGFLAIFLAPLEWWPALAPATAPSMVVLWLLRWLLVRLMFSSGYVKLRSGDAAWRSLTALNYHYETQPLPTPLAWFAHQLPPWFHRASAVVMFVVELAVPWLFLWPQPWCAIAGAITVGLMFLIAATGNYCFFNLLTVALCLLTVSDQQWIGLTEMLGVHTKSIGLPSALPAAIEVALLTLAALTLFLSFDRLCRTCRREIRWPRALAWLRDALQPLCLANSYGLFSIMTTTRPEIIVEGSDDGQTWLAYEFKWKPGDVKRAPRFVAPHQPRLDWQMWFAALSDYSANPWFKNFLGCVHRGEPMVLALLEKNPFPEKPPRFLRATLYDYRFTDFKTRRETGDWWQREKQYLYVPVLADDDQDFPP
ncbi:MAG: lipase maturation factor family protein [Verrucomicrobia bacterium]|nr:lipase maturation factor family protein [Verrucomicrobiota bacterium]